MRLALNRGKTEIIRLTKSYEPNAPFGSSITVELYRNIYLQQTRKYLVFKGEEQLVFNVYTNVMGIYMLFSWNLHSRFVLLGLMRQYTNKISKKINDPVIIVSTITWWYLLSWKLMYGSENLKVFSIRCFCYLFGGKISLMRETHSKKK